jgi:hypothetical protein
VFGYVDQDRYHLLQLGAVRRLLRVADGAVQSLWQDIAPFRTDRMGLVTVDSLGGELRLYLDGAPLTVLEAAGCMTGAVGLASSLTAGVRFGGVRVSAPRWASYHEFDRDQTLPAGARVRLHAGNPLAASTAEPGVAERFAASLDDAGRLRLAPRAAELRLRGPDGREHTRRLLPDQAYTPVAVQAIRKADATAFFIAAPIPPGAYRLIMTYRRDNRPSDALVLSENGIQSPEVATIAFSIADRAGVP